MLVVASHTTRNTYIQNNGEKKESDTGTRTEEI